MQYKQQSNQGCLIISLLYLFSIEPTRELERSILGDGLFKLRQNYTLGCLLSFLDRYADKSVTVYVDNKYYLGVMQMWVRHPRIQMEHSSINLGLLESLTPPFIVYVDNHITDGWTHLPHYMMIVSASSKFYDVLDPWTGKTSKLSKQKVLLGVDLLRSHIKVCPFVITCRQ